MKKLKLILILFILSGCATVTKLSTNDGSESYFVDCSKFSSGLIDCYSKANELCKRGYIVLDQKTGMVHGMPLANIRIMCKK